MSNRPALPLLVGVVAVALLTVALGYAVPSSPPAIAPVVLLELNSGGPPIPAGPTIFVEVENGGDAPIAHLAATLYLGQPYPIGFQNVTRASPLPPGGVTSTSRILVRAAFACDAAHPLVFNGTYASGSPFNETLSAPISCWPTN